MSGSNSNRRSIEYLVICSDAKGIEGKFLFHQHTVSSSLCGQITQSTTQQKTQVLALMFDLVKTHDNEVLQARSWSCVECNRPATAIIHNPTSCLHLDKPQIIDFAAPCCADKTCDTQIQFNFDLLMALVGIPNGMS